MSVSQRRALYNNTNGDLLILFLSNLFNLTISYHYKNFLSSWQEQAPLKERRSKTQAIGSSFLL